MVKKKQFKFLFTEGQAKTVQVSFHWRTSTQ